MKKTLLIVVLVISCHQLFAFCTQGNWRWRKDDGSETSATWLANQNTAPTISNSSENIRLRIEYYNTATKVKDSSGLGTSVLEYSVLGSDIWDSITTTSTDKDFILAASPNVVDSQLTTNQLTTQPGYTFQDGRIVTSSDVLKQQYVYAQNTTEYEWVIKPTENLKTNTTYIFNLYVIESAYDTTAGISRPTLKTADVLAVRYANFAVSAEGNKVRIIWTTASEQNNDRFDVERSTDGRTWKTVTTIKGNGTSTDLHTYKVYDNTPAAGMNYYRIKQYDHNGKAFVSDVRSLKMLLDHISLVKVYPNPAKDVISFMLNEVPASDIVVTLVSSNGRVIHSETIKNVQANTKYVLNMKSQPAKGTYMLQVKAEGGLSESVKVVVQ